MPLPDENKGKSAKDLIARFQTNINASSEAPLKPRHSFGSNERFEGDNSNPDISEAKRVPSSRISNARASLEAGLSALSLSRSASGTSSSSLSSTSREQQQPVDRQVKATTPAHESTSPSMSTSSSHVDAPATAPESVSSDSLNRHENATNIDATQNNKDEAAEGTVSSTLGDKVPGSAVPKGQEDQQSADTVSQRDIPTAAPAGIEERPGSATTSDATSKTIARTGLATKSSTTTTEAGQLDSSSRQNPVLAKTRNLPKVNALGSSSGKAVPSEEKSQPPSSGSASSTSKTPSKPTLSSGSTSSANSRAVKTPSQATSDKKANTSRGTKSATRTSPAMRPVVSPSPMAASSARLTKPTEASAKKAAVSPTERVSEHTKPTTSARATFAATTSSRANNSSTASTSGSRPTSVQSSSSTAKIRTTPLASSTSRRTASESTDGSSSISAQNGTKGKKAMTPAELGRMQAASSPSSSKTALARSRSGLGLPATTSTPAKSPTKSSSAGKSGSPASTPPSADTLARLTRPTIASQAHARSPARSPVGMPTSPSTRAGMSPKTGSGRPSAGAPTSLKKARSYAGTSAVGSRAKVPKDTLAQAETGETEQRRDEPAKAPEEETVPEADDIPEIPAEDEIQPASEDQPGTHSQESSAGQSEGDLLAPPLSTTSSSVTEGSAINDPVTEPEETSDKVTEKVFTGFGPNRPYGKIGLPTEEATPEESAARPMDEENKILPPTLRIKQPRDLEEALNGTQNKEGPQEDFADRWGSRDGGSPLPVRSPGLTSVKFSDENNAASSSATDNGNSSVEGQAPEKKVPIWMRKGGEA